MNKFSDGLGYCEVCEDTTPSKGLQQDDLLSPFMCLFCTKGLSCLLSKAEREDKINRLKFGTSDLYVSLIYFLQIIILCFLRLI